MAFDLRTALATAAPTLAGMLGGPLAGTAVAALENCFGLTPSAGATLDQRKGAITDVMQAGGMTPEILASVRAADQKHQEILGQQGIDLVRINADHEQAQDQIAASDRDSARKREVAVKDHTVGNLAYIIIGGFFAVAIAQLVALMGWPEFAAKIPQPGWLLIGNISGYLAAEARSAANYYFGTSAGSERKTDIIAAQNGQSDQAQG